MTPPSPTSAEPHRLVYGYVPYHASLAFADADTAADEAAEMTSLAACRTYGEARRLETRHVSWKPGAEDDDEPADDEPYDIRQTGAVLDGDWPEMVTSRALRLVPPDLVDLFGEQEQTTLNADYVTIPEEHEADLVAQLRARGYEVDRDDELINTLDGRGVTRED